MYTIYHIFGLLYIHTYVMYIHALYNILWQIRCHILCYMKVHYILLYIKVFYIGKQLRNSETQVLSPVRINSWYAIYINITNESLTFKAIQKCLNNCYYRTDRFSSVQSLSHVQLFATPWTAACQASLSITRSRRLLKFMPIESVMPSKHLILCHPLLLPTSIFPSIRVFSMSQLFASGDQSIGVSASTSVPPMDTQDWSPLGWTGWISLQSKRLSRVFSNTTVQKHQLLRVQLSL